MMDESKKQIEKKNQHEGSFYAVKVLINTPARFERKNGEVWKCALLETVMNTTIFNECPF